MVWDGYTEIEKFKIGDKIVLLYHAEETVGYLKIGRTYTVSNIYGSLLYLKEMEGIGYNTRNFELKDVNIIKQRLGKLEKIRRNYKWYRRLFRLLRNKLWL